MCLLMSAYIIDNVACVRAPIVNGRTLQAMARAPRAPTRSVPAGSDPALRMEAQTGGQGTIPIKDTDLMMVKDRFNSIN